MTADGEVWISLFVRPVEHPRGRGPVRARPSGRAWRSRRSCPSTSSWASTRCSSTTTMPCRTWTSCRPAQIGRAASQMRQMLEDHGLVAEFVAPRLWENPRTIDGGLHRQTVRKTANTRSTAASMAVDIARELGCDLIVLWLAREGTYMRESKDIVRSTQYLLEAVNALLALRQAHPHRRSSPSRTSRWTSPTSRPSATRWPSGFQSDDPKRVGVLIEIGPLDPGRAGPVGRNRLRPGVRQAVERAPERPERPEVRPGQVVRRGRPAPGVQPGAGARRARLPESRHGRAGRQGAADAACRAGNQASAQLAGDVPAPGRAESHAWTARGSPN